MHTVTGGILALATSLVVANLSQPTIRPQRVAQPKPSNSSVTACQVQMSETSTTQEQVSPNRNLSHQPAPQLALEERERLLEKTEIEPQSVQCSDANRSTSPNR